MKGRSHRLPINDAPDDWGDGSWTVDCVCGVNFDDGEEMVNCDECGVWVHTRCSRFKGDDSFACDKCKRKKSRNDNEEEVAQLLVELPTKTLAMDPPSAPSLRLWTEIPIHERAHVHGIPGGDPALFPAISSVFTRELWKCSGYVPKKFNFQYREFPCWDTDRDRDRDRDDKPQTEDNDNPVDRGADALFSLSKEIVSPNPVDMLVGLRGSVETASRDRDRDKFRREGKKREADDSTVKHVHNNGVKRETNTIPIPSPSHLGKRKKENIRTKDLHSGKKKARSASKIVDGKRRVSITSLGTQIESQRVGEPKAAEKEFQSSIRVNKLSLDHAAPDSCLDGNKSKTKGNLANSSHYTEDSIKKTKHKDSVAAAAYHVEDSLQKVKSRDNLAVIGDDSSKKVKPRVGLEVNNRHANDLIRKKSKDKSLVKSHHFDDSSKMVKTKDNLTPSAYRGEDSKEAWKNSSLVEIVVKSENGHQAPTRTGSSSDTVAIEVSLLEPNGISPVKDYQGLNTSVDSLDCPSDVKHDRRDVCRKSSTTPLSSPKLKPSIGERSNVIPAMQDAPSHEDSMNGMLTSSLKSSMKVKTEASVDHSTGNSGALSSPTIDAKLDSMKQLKITVPEDAHENNQVHKTHIGSVLSDEAAVTELKAVSCVEKNNGIEGTIPISGEPCQNKEVIGSAGTLSVQESSELKHFKSAEEPSKTGVVKPSPASPLSQRRVVAAFGKSSPSTTVLISKSEVSGSCKPPGRPASPSTLRPIHFTKRVKANSNLCADIKKDHTAVDAAKDEFKQEEPKKAAKEQLKSSAVSASKLSHMSRVSHATISKRPILDPKEPVLCPSPKPPAPQNVTVTSSSIETARNVSPAQNKTPALSSSERSERSNQSGSQQSPKVAPHSSSMHPPPPVNSSSTLSDEELALLLHQELNSSPRVPRVPRMRHASSIPQAPPTPASMLIKRASGSGLKDHISALRRKNKEDGYRNSSRELIDETKKSNVLLSSSHGHRKQDQVVVSDACAKKEAVDISPDTAKRNAPATTNSGNSEATEQNLSSMRNSPGNTSDDDYNDDTSAVAGPATRTLPGLLDEIMSKGKRMTYEELCNAVLPHWNKLRKHNGERYAYSSHSQAVLDCLRNRNEWAQLVDRGPKTTGGRKKRSKVEEEEAEEEGEYEGHNKSRSSNVVEDFPKGKRKARKRRRLSLQGRGIREVRKNKRQQKTTSSSEEEEDSSPESSESMFSEESNVGSMEEEGVVG